MQIPISMHQIMAHSGLKAELGRMANPTGQLQRIPKYNCYIHRDVDFTLGTFIENK